MALNAYFVIGEVLLYVFHLSVLILLIAKRKTTFKGPFYSIFRIVMVADFLNFFYMVGYQYISVIPILIPFFKSNHWFATIMISFFSYVIVIVFSGHLFMAFNRFTLIWFPLHYQQIWSKKWYTYMLIFFLPFLNICWRLHEPATYLYVSESSSKVVYLSEKITFLHFIVSTIIFLSTTFLAAIFNGLSLLRFWLYKTSAICVKERHLLFVSLTTFIFQLLRTGYAVQQVLFPNNASLTTFFIQTMPFFTDGFALSGSISLLILSKSSRKLYFSFYFGKCMKRFHLSKIPANNTTRYKNPTPNSTVKYCASIAAIPRITIS